MERLVQSSARNCRDFFKCILDIGDDIIFAWEFVEEGFGSVFGLNCDLVEDGFIDNDECTAEGGERQKGRQFHVDFAYRRGVVEEGLNGGGDNSTLYRHMCKLRYDSMTLSYINSSLASTVPYKISGRRKKVMRYESFKF